MFSCSTTSSIIRSVAGYEFSLTAVPFETPPPYFRRFRRLPSGMGSGISAILLCLSFDIEVQALIRRSMFRPSVGSNPPTMSSADFCRFSDASRHRLSTMLEVTYRQISPGNAHLPSHLCPPHLLPRFPYRYRALKILAFSPITAALHAISVRRVSALPAASFRSLLTEGTLAVQLTVPPIGPVGDFHSQVGAPCRAHQK